MNLKAVDIAFSAIDNNLVEVQYKINQSLDAFSNLNKEDRLISISLKNLENAVRNINNTRQTIADLKTVYKTEESEEEIYE